ncbi:MAG: hypothetical protein ABI456_23025 [Ktedonobacteraceae bacterium]|nr:hypothetical protein [Chloroflexota bacterium]
MTQQQMMMRDDESRSEGRLRPGRFDVFLHAIKTLKLVGALIADGRVSIVRKLLFFGAIGGLVVVLFFPDLFGELAMSTVLPLVGTVLGVPIDAGFDWAAFALVSVSLLRFFPTELVAEHYRRIFR